MPAIYAAAEAKNAGASWTALLIPMLPKETDRDVFSHAIMPSLQSSERLMLRTAVRVRRVQKASKIL